MGFVFRGCGGSCDGGAGVGIGGRLWFGRKETDFFERQRKSLSDLHDAAIGDG